MKDIDADYYGYRDDDDGILLPLEADEEKRAIAEKVGMWKRQKEESIESGKAAEEEEEEDIYAVDKGVSK